MFEIIQEAVLPKLSQTQLFVQFNEKSNIAESIKKEISKVGEYGIKPDDIPEILALIKLNGDPIAKQALEAYKKGQLIVINNKETSSIPSNLPYIVIGQGSSARAFVFADKVVNNIQSTQEYTSLMAVIEASFLALQLNKKQDMFTLNRPLLLTLCNIYTLMAVAPLEQKLYMKGDNLVKAMLYIIGYFYKMIDGNNITAESVPFQRIIADKVDKQMVDEIFKEVCAVPNLSFLEILKLIEHINPIRYKNLDTLYLTHFISTCGVSLIFALENISYLFLLLSSSTYKTQLTAYGINKTVGLPVKKANAILASISFI